MGAMHHHQWQQMGIQSEGWYKLYLSCWFLATKSDFWGLKLLRRVTPNFPQSPQCEILPKKKR
jgi:hypothetical protein